MNALLLLAWALPACLLAAPVALLGWELAAARRASAREVGSGRRPPLAVLVPAHNEAAGIAATIACIAQQLLAGDRLLVVADNCSDETAAVAAAAGAEVIERSSALRGKGYALACGIDHLRQRPPHVLVIVDADCQLGPDCLPRLAVAAASLGRPVQAAYLMGLRDPGHATAAKRVAAFAWLLKNWSRPLGAMRLGLPCHLFGSGMAFPWDLAAQAPFASGHLAEDVKLGLDLALAGSPVHFCPLAIVTSVFADNPAGAASQRTRWEHGHLALLTSYGPRLLAAACRQRRRDLLFLGADLCIPPLSLLVLLAAALAGSALLAAWWTNWAIAALPCTVCATLLAILARAWNQVGRHILPARQLLAAVGYALRKLPLYARFLIKRQVDWVASHRDPG